MRLALAGVASLSAAVLLSGCGGGGGTSVVTCTPTPNFPPGVAHGPQVALPTPNAITIALWTSQAASGVLSFGLDTGYGMTVSDQAPVTVHAFALTGLVPATTYHYQIALDGQPAVADRTFRTPPDDPAAPFRFVAIGDTGSGCQEEFDAIARLQALTPDFVLNTGDCAYAHGTPGEVFSHHLVPFAPVFETTPVFVVIGNHDFETNNGQPLLDAMVLPTNTLNGSESFYSFDWGGCHIAALNSEADTAAGSAQATWLDSDLAASGALWKFVFLHFPMYSSSRHGSNLTLRADLEPIIDAHHVDVVFNGHDHDYERTFPMLASVPTDVASNPDYVNPSGTIFITTGGGGQTLYDNGTSDFTAFSLSAHHVTQVDVQGGHLELRAVLSDGTVVDTMSITKM